MIHAFRPYRPARAGTPNRLVRIDAEGKCWHLGQDGWFRFDPPPGSSLNGPARSRLPAVGCSHSGGYSVLSGQHFMFRADQEWDAPDAPSMRVREDAP